MIVFDHYVYVSGPAWMPMVVVVPVLGTLVGLLVGVVVAARGLRWSRQEQGGCWLVAVALGAIGLLGGVVTAVAAAVHPPRLLVTTSTTASSDLYAIEGAPWHVDLSPIALLFPALGLAVGVALALIAVAFELRLGKGAGS
ncbi:hypothetical protein [Rhodococcus tibetensis]|uniref:Integral membrane protein n=1 Tax=Rhodococcus tibetensis TaxID=2965064 RepID=A0ABT1QCK1_9NOCA|nr:hypothetical protein [Rhodococcus sp. FXJ9.536]MCQ4120004.1 hypothetical protein [Rhodococcus sp. FXJ9.536]